MRSIVLEVDETDYNAIQLAIAERERWGVLPDSDGNIEGRTVAEICRGWMERLKVETD